MPVINDPVLIGFEVFVSAVRLYADDAFLFAEDTN